MAVEVTRSGDDLVFTIHGIDKLFTFTGSLTIPAVHVSSVSKAPEMSRQDIGLKLVGAGIPGLIRAGTYSGKDGLAFWDVKNYDKAIMLELHDERYARLFLEVEDPEKAIALIQDAIAESS